MNALVWFIGAVLLAVLELFGGDFALLMLSGGALSAAGVSFFKVPLWVSVVVFAVVSLTLMFVLRPFLKRKLSEKIETADLSPRALVGTTGETVEQISSSSGIVRLNSDFWSARSAFHDDVFEPGDTVVVSRIEGNTAFVLERKD